MRLDDVYYSTQPIEGTPEPTPPSVPIDFYQGEDIVFEIFLNYHDCPVVPEQWVITAKIKKNKYAQTVLWTGTLNSGVYKTDIPGFYKIIFPSEATSLFVAGTYWLSISVKESKSKDYKDLQFVIVEQPFSINYSVSSPYPGQVLDTTAVERTSPPATGASMS